MKYFNLTDTYFNNSKPSQVIFARSAAFDIAQRLGLNYFLTLDDDINDFCYRYVEDNKFMSKHIKNLDPIIDATLDFLKSTKISSLCFADDSFYYGGANGDRYKKRLIPGLYNSMFYKTDDRIWFEGNLNEDRMTLIRYWNRGKLCLMNMEICNQLPKVSTVKGGTYESYKSVSEYMRTWYHIIPYPSCVKVNMKNYRPVVNNKLLYPKIISDIFKK